MTTLIQPARASADSQSAAKPDQGGCSPASDCTTCRANASWDGSCESGPDEIEALAEAHLFYTPTETRP